MRWAVARTVLVVAGNVPKIVRNHSVATNNAEWRQAARERAKHTASSASCTPEAPSVSARGCAGHRWAKDSESLASLGGADANYGRGLGFRRSSSEARSRWRSIRSQAEVADGRLRLGLGEDDGMHVIGYVE